MEISYEHANPRKGNESYIIRISEDHVESTSCILVDAGDGIDLDSLLGTHEHLSAILLTHAHLDHYKSIDDAHCHGAPIITSPDTAAILDDVFAEGERRYNLSETDELLGRVEPVSEWYDVLGDTVKVRPVYAGHAPGACGFLIHITDGEQQVRILATGDFTERDAAGYPGLDPNAHPEVDILFLTAATNEEMGPQLTEIVGEVTARTNAGSKTLCTASGLTGVHLATLFAAVDDELNVSVPVILAGHVAKLYDALGYGYENVTAVPEFASTAECFEHGGVTIAGPEVPVEGSSGRLFEAIEDDASATLIQIQGGATEAKTQSDCAGTVSSYEFSNHPSEEVLNDVVESVSPIHTVIEHQQGGNLQQYKDKWDSFSWATGSGGEEILYQDGQYIAPHWVNDYIKQRVRNREGQIDTSRADDALLDAVEVIPEVDRRSNIDLSREGINISAIEERLHAGSPPATAGQEAASSEPNGNVEANDNHLYPTTGPELPGKSRTRRSEIGLGDLGHKTSPEGLIDTTQPHGRTGIKGSQLQSAANEIGTEKANGEKSELSEESGGEKTSREDNEKQSTERRTTESESTVVTQLNEHIGASAKSSFTVEVDPAVRALARQRAEEVDDSLDIFVRHTVESYISDILRGTDAWADTAPIERSLDIEVDAALEELLTQVVTEKRIDSMEKLTLNLLKEATGLNKEVREITLRDSGSLSAHLAAVAENDASPHETRDAVVQAALERVLLE